MAGRVLDLGSGEESTGKFACSGPAGRSAPCSSRRTSGLATTSRSARSGEDRSGSHASMYPTLRWLDTTARDRDRLSSWPIDVATDKGDALHGTDCRLPGLVRTPVLVDGRSLSGGLSTLRETYADFGIRAGNGVGEVASAPGESRRFAPPPLRYGLWDEVKDRVHESGVALSGGRQQRLRIVRALTIRPDILRITSRRRFQSWRRTPVTRPLTNPVRSNCDGRERNEESKADHQEDRLVSERCRRRRWFLASEHPTSVCMARGPDLPLVRLDPARISNQYTSGLEDHEQNSTPEVHRQLEGHVALE